MKNETKKMGMSINSEIWEKFRLRAIKQDLTVKEAVESAIVEFLGIPTPGIVPPEENLVINIPVKKYLHRLLKGRALQEKRTLKDLLELVIVHSVTKIEF